MSPAPSDRLTDDPTFQSEQARPTDAPNEVVTSLHPNAKSTGRHRVRWITLVVGVVVTALVVVLVITPPASQYAAQSPLVGHRAPAFEGTTITGQPYRLGGLRGHYVVVDFFASWCVPCRQEQGQLVTFAKEQRNGARLVGVIFNDTNGGIRSMLGPWVGLYPVIPDPGGRIALDYGVGAPPDKFLIDPRGVVVARVIGPVTAAGLNALIARAKSQGV